MRVALVAAEPSGDRLGAGLMKALARLRPGVRFEGIGGAGMLDAGLHPLAGMERLSVMGLVEVLGRLPELLALRRRLARRWLADPPDLFVGIDAPDFNLGLETTLRAGGVPTLHYVSPTVWAWREKRVKKLRRAADLVLCIFPFEPDFLVRHGVSARFVGHPLAADYPLAPDRAAARAELALPAQDKVLALLPGSRLGEIERIAPPFLGAARRLAEAVPGLRVVTPTATEATRARFEALVRELAPDLPLSIHPRATRAVLSAADLAVVASGTATLEGLLSHTPMVVGYRMNPLTHALIRGLGLLRTERVAMANLLAGEELVPELLQDQCRPENLFEELMKINNKEFDLEGYSQKCRQIHHSLRLNTDQLAAEAALALAEGQG